MTTTTSIPTPNPSLRIPFSPPPLFTFPFYHRSHSRSHSLTTHEPSPSTPHDHCCQYHHGPLPMDLSFSPSHFHLPNSLPPLPLIIQDPFPSSYIWSLQRFPQPLPLPIYLSLLVSFLTFPARSHSFQGRFKAAALFMFSIMRWRVYAAVMWPR